MDLARFGLTRRPFRSTPDTDAYFPAATHELALAGLRHAFEARDGITLVDGEPGTGKTIVALRFLETLDPDVPRVWIPAPRFVRPTDFFQAILFDLGVEHRDHSEHELRLVVTDHLLAKLSAGYPTAIVFDEAQHLTPEALEELRLLGNLETRSAKAAFVVMLAQPGFRKRLSGSELSAFAQRVGLRCRLESLTRDESERFIRHQLTAAGGTPDDLVTEEALALLASACGGRPRVLNQAASLAFNLSGLAGETCMDVEAAIEALAQLGLKPDEPPAVLPHPAKKTGARKPKRRSA